MVELMSIGIYLPERSASALLMDSALSTGLFDTKQWRLESGKARIRKHRWNKTTLQKDKQQGEQ